LSFARPVVSPVSVNGSDGTFVAIEQVSPPLARTICGASARTIAASAATPCRMRAKRGGRIPRADIG
jgi:hypothetical protein